MCVSEILMYTDGIYTLNNNGGCGTFAVSRENNKLHSPKPPQNHDNNQRSKVHEYQKLQRQKELGNLPLDRRIY